MAATLSQAGSTSGAGDTFAAGIVAYEVVRPGKQIKTYAINASQAAIRHIGCDRYFPASAFEVKKIDMKTGK